MRALIFDLDGTLIDTVYAHVFAWQRALAESGLAIDGWKIHRRIGMSGGCSRARSRARSAGRSATAMPGGSRPGTASLSRAASRAPAAAGRDRASALAARSEDPARHRHVRSASRNRQIARGAGSASRYGGRRPRRRASRETRARPLSAVPGAARRRDPRLLCRRRCGVGSPRRASRGMLSVGLLSGGYG